MYEGLADAADLLKALANPHRLAVILELRAGERCVHELVAAVGISQPLLSQHLRVLKGARLIAGTRRGKEIAYRLADDHVSHIAADALTHAGERGATEAAS